jgi:Dolichyl-phosphate-mannose-protein mannosyltransferase
MTEPLTTHHSPLTRIDWIFIAALFALVLPLRIWLLCNTEVTARDSIGYIRYALEFERKNLDGTPKPWQDVLKRNHQHPGYPVLVLLMSQPVRVFDGATTDGQATPENMEVSAQLVNLIASMLLILPMYFLGRQFFDRTVSFGGALLYQYLPISGQLMSDGVSEPIYLVFLVSGLLQMVQAVRERSVWRSQLCGVFTGLAYLTRPEGALILPTFAGVLIALQFRAAWRCSWRQFLECGTSAAVCAALVGSVYVVTTGHLSNKPTFDVMTHKKSVAQARDPLAGPQLFAAAVPTTDTETMLLVRSGWAVCMEVNQGFHYIAGIPALLGLIWSFGSLRRDPGYWAMMLFVGLHALILIRLGMIAHYISDRHVMIIVLPGCYYAVFGLRELPRRLLAWRTRDLPGDIGSAGASPSRMRFAGVVFAVLFLGTIGFCLPKVTQRLHGNRAANHEAGLWLRSVLEVGDHVEDDHAWSHYYSGGVIRENQIFNIAPERVPTTWVVTTRSRDAEIDAKRQENVLSDQAKLIKWWPETSDLKQARVVVYSQPRDPVKNPWGVVNVP